MKASRPFTAYGQALALNPAAFGMLVIEGDAPEARDVGGGVWVVDVRGPLMHHADPFCDSYDGIKARAGAAMASGARAVVLSIDSPGGLVSGMLDTAEELRVLADSHECALLAYVDGQATSAAYALACAADRIFVPSTGVVGSIGVVDALVDSTAEDAALGIRYSFVASGTRKTDGNPHVPTTEAAVAAAQGRVDALAALFFAHVEARRGVPAAELASLQAGLFHGADAVSRGLADQVATLDQVIELARAGRSAPMSGAEEVRGMNLEEAIGALRKAAEGDDENAARARKALAAFDGEPDGDEPEKKGEESKAEGEDDKHEEPDGDEAPKAAAKSAAESMAARALAMVERAERARIFGARPDLSEEQRKALASVPVEKLEAVVRAIPRPATKPAATVQVAPTVGGGSNAPSIEAANRELGIRPAARGIVVGGLAQKFHAMTPGEARELIAQKGGDR